MIRLRTTIVLLGLSAILAGCGGGAPATLPEEQKAPAYGQQTGDMMKNMMGTPSAKGMVPPKPAAK